MGKRMGANRRRRAGTASRRNISALIATALLAAVIGVGVRMVPLLHVGSGTQGIASLIERLFCPQPSVVTAMNVVGSRHVTAGEVCGRLGIHLPMAYSPMKKMLLAGLQRVSPWIAGAKLDGPHNGMLTVVITERKPVAMSAKPSVLFVDTAGVFIPFDPHAGIHFPLVSGLRDSAGAESPRLMDDDRGRMNQLLRGLTAFDPGIVSRVTQAHFGAGGTVSLWLEGSPTEITLDGNNLASGLERLVELLPSVRGDSGIPARIDLSCRNLAFVTTGVIAGGGAGKARLKG